MDSCPGINRLIGWIRKVASHSADAIRFGRPRGVTGIDRLRMPPHSVWRPAFPADSAPRHPPRRMGRISADLHAMALPIPETGVLALPGGRAVARGGFTFAADGRAVRETTWHGDDLTRSLLPASFPRPRRVKGVCLSLLSEFASFNYGHYVLDSLSRVEIARQAGFVLADIDWFYLPRPPSRSARQLLSALGIDEERCLWAEDVPSIVADTLLVTTFPGTKRNYARFVPQAIRRPFAKAGGGGSRRIFIPRRGARKLANTTEIEAIAVQLGLEIHDFRTVDDEFARLREADLVVGPHGSDLANIAVCREGAKVLELVPSDHVHPYFYTLAEGAGLDYCYLVGTSAGERAGPRSGPSPFDFHVDPDEFRGAVQALLAELEG